MSWLPGLPVNGNRWLIDKTMFIVLLGLWFVTGGIVGFTIGVLLTSGGS